MPIPDCLVPQNGSFLIEAPWPGAISAIILPRPQFDDSENAQLTIDVKRTINGTRYTYVNTTNRRFFSYDFILSRDKYFELRQFIIRYPAVQLRVTNHKNEMIVGYFASDPFEFVEENRNSVTITLEFDGVKQ